MQDGIVAMRHEQWWIVKYVCIAIVWFLVGVHKTKNKNENRMKKQVGIKREWANCYLTKTKIYKWAHINLP